jgi:hypothetical protein
MRASVAYSPMLARTGGADGRSRRGPLASVQTAGLEPAR